jgi:transposase
LRNGPVKRGGFAYHLAVAEETDQEDTLKLAKYLRDTPAEERCVVPLPSEVEEQLLSAISLKEYLNKERTAAINRLHALYGLIDVTKKDLKDGKGRHGELPPLLQEYATILEAHLELFEQKLAVMAEKVAEQARNHELIAYIMSIPGIGIAAVILAYIGDGSRFSKADQVAKYAGLSPRVDCSGETERYGSIER